MAANPLLKPAINILDKLRFPHKFVFISVFFLLPLTALSVALIWEESEKFSAAGNNQTALNYLAALRPLTEHIAETRGMTNTYLNGGREFESRIMAKRSEVDTELNELQRVDAQLGQAYQTGDRAARIRDQWDVLQKTAFEKTPAATFAEYTALIDSILDLMVHVSESSGLVLGTELDAYYLADSLVNSLPLIAENIGKSRGLGSGIAADGQMANAQFLKLSDFINDVIKTRKKMEHGFDVALRLNPRLQGSLAEPLAAAKTATDNFIHTSRSALLEASAIEIEPAAYFQMGTDAISANLKLYDLVLPVLNDVYQQRIDAKKRDRLYLIAGIVLVVCACFYLFMGLYQSIMQSINAIVRSVDQISEGDLTVCIADKGKDELALVKTRINRMVEKFRHLVAQVVTVAEQVVEASGHTSRLSTQTTKEISRQNGEIEQVATAIEEMSATIHEVAQNTSNAADATGKADEATESGQAIVNQTIESISRLSDEMANASTVVQALEANSAEIGTVLKVIRDIADQTNLLALNAAIEAARAGEQGRGFAVVADEVRTLAGRTQESTLEIHSIIERLQHGAINAVKVIEHGVTSTNATVERAVSAGAALKAIGSAVASIKAMNIQIASAAEQQSMVASEVSRNIANISDLAARNHEVLEETTKTSQAMHETAQNLRVLVNEFKVA